MLTLRAIAAATLVLALVATGCGQKESSFRSANNGRTARPISDADIARAREAKAPKILPETHFAAAKLFDAQGVYDKAIEQYRKAIALNHNYVDAYHRLGLLYSRLGQRKEALTYLQKAVKLSPKSGMLRNNYGFELLLNGEWTMAEGEFIQAIHLQPDFTRAYVNLGITNSKLGRFDAALESFRTVLPETDAYYNLGLMYRSHKRTADARSAFQHVLKLDPNFAAAKTQLTQLDSPQSADKDAALVRTVADRPNAPTNQASHPGQSMDPVTIPADIRTGEPPASQAPASQMKGKQTSNSVSSGDMSWEETFAIIDGAMNQERGQSGRRERLSMPQRSSRSRPAAGALGSDHAVSTSRSARGPVSTGPVDSATYATGGFSPADIRIGSASSEFQPYSITPSSNATGDSTYRGFESPDSGMESSLNTTMMLSDLEDRLAVLRNEIDCLDEIEPPTADDDFAAIGLDGTRSSKERESRTGQRPTKARLSSDLIEPASSQDLGAGSRTRSPERTDRDVPIQRNRETDDTTKSKSPTSARDTWRDEFRSLERIASYALTAQRARDDRDER